MKYIDSFLNTITMYKLVMFGLLACAVYALGAAALGFIGFSPVALSISLVVLILVSYVTNTLATRFLRTPQNIESSIITGLILFFILFPPSTTEELMIVVLAGIGGVLTKYVFAYKKRHLFNPAALVLVIIALMDRGEAIWWVGSPVMLPLILVLSLLIVRKIERMPMFFAFVISALGMGTIVGVATGVSFGTIVNTLFVAGPLLFLGGIMLTEPLTTPPRKSEQVVYGALVGALATAPFHIGNTSITPELALVLGNIYAYVVSSKQRLDGVVREVVPVAENTYEVVLSVNAQPQFLPGQYAECTVGHDADMRGVRRYFTIASHPEDSVLRFGLRFDKDRSSSFKRALVLGGVGTHVVVNGISGQFTMPTSPDAKCLFIAGGIGVTPFVSMVRHVLATGETRDMALVYANKRVSEIAYRTLFTDARAVGLATTYVVNEAVEGWDGKVGFVSKELLLESVPDILERTVYVSGPHVMVVAIQKALTEIGVPKRQIKTDFFPGYA